MTWYTGPLAGFDLETTGVDIEQDRIVTAAVLGVARQRWANGEDNPLRWLAVERYGWTANPGIDIPEQATAVHGITTEFAREKGWPAAGVVRDITIILAEHVQQGTPIVAMNARFDLSLLDRETARYGLPSLADLAGCEPYVIDPLVLDKQVDRYRRGKRRLGDLCAHYGVSLDGAHNAGVDALAGMRVAVAIAERHPHIGAMTLPELHEQQKEWARQQAESLREYLTGQGRDATDVHGHWPLIPRPAEWSDR